jgi:hypothetical protein
LIVLPERVARHWQSAIAVEGVNIVEHATANAGGKHHDSVREFPIEQRP